MRFGSDPQIDKFVDFPIRGRNANEPGRVPSIEKNGSRKEQRLESMAGRVRLPILAFR